MNWLDAHNHLQDVRLRPYREEVIAAWQHCGGGRMVVNGTREDDWAEVAMLAREHAWILPSFGLHPWYVQEASPMWQEIWLSYVKGCACAVGEIGLDTWMPKSNLEKQKEAFRFQLETAAFYNLPTTIHCLRAWGPLLEILRETMLPPRGFLLHSYSGSAELVQPLVRLGAYFSISGYFAHERKAAARAVFQSIPMDRLLVETDAPDMLGPADCAPNDLWDGETGKLLNQPANLPAIYQFAADLRGVTVDRLVEVVAANFEVYFQRQAIRDGAQEKSQRGLGSPSPG